MLRYRTQIIVAAMFFLIGATGCKSSNQSKKTAPAQEQTAATQIQAPAAQEPAALPQSNPSTSAIKGKVLETMNAGTYTYLQIDTPQGPVWVAMPQTKVKKGREVAVQHGMEMKNFKSKTLNRTFKSIIFSNGIIGQNAVAQPQTGNSGDSFAQALQSETARTAGPAMASSGGSIAAIVPSADIKIDKAKGDNAYTIGEIFEKRTDLNNKKIMVRGKVMKVSMMIMGKNWIHLQDGTGNPLKNTHDLVVTTRAKPKKNSIISVEGTLHADKDFGAGYYYKAIIEDAEIK